MSQIDNSYECFSTDLFVKGDNHYSQCGIDNVDYLDRLKKINFSMVIREIACGRFHTLILTNEGQVYSFGSNDQGQLGVNGLDQACAPVLVQGLEQLNCIEIAAGEYHSDERQVYVWGNKQVEPHFVRLANQIKCGLNFTILMDECLLLMKGEFTQQLQIDETITDYGCSANELFYLDDQSQLFLYGQKRIFNEVQQLFSGYYLSFIAEDGSLYYYRETKIIKIELNFLVMDCSFSRDEGLVLDENNRAAFIDLNNYEITKINMAFHSISCGVNHMMLIGMIQRGSKVNEQEEEDDSIIEQNLSPIQQREQQQVTQQNNTFSFSIKKDIQLLHSIKLSHKEVQTDLDSTQQLIKENEELKKALAQQKKNFEIQLEFQNQYNQTLQEQVYRLQNENQLLKQGKNKQQLLIAIRQKQINIRKLIDEFYQQ